MQKIIAALAIAATLSVGACVKLSNAPPTDLPAYVKIMPGAQQLGTMDMGVMKGEMFQTTSSLDDVVAFYRTQAQADGLPEQPTQGATDPSKRQATFSDGGATRMLTVVAQTQNGGTMVTLAYRPATAGAPAAPTNAAS
jgi:hypothetical protein